MAKMLLFAVLTAILAAPVYAYDGVTGDTLTGAPLQEPDRVTGAMPDETGPTEVSGPSETNPAPGVESGPVHQDPAWMTRAGLEEATRRVLTGEVCQSKAQQTAAPKPQVWHGTVAGRQRTEVFVRERGRTRTVYAGPRLTASKVNDLIAEWARKAGVASQSFVRKHVESRIAPLRRELGGIGQDVASIKGDISKLQGRVAGLEAKSQEIKPTPTAPAKGSLRQLWRENPLLVLAIPFLLFVIGGCLALIYRTHRNRGGTP